MSAHDLLRALENAASDYADAKYDEGKQRQYIEVVESEIAASLIGTPNPLTNKEHSASSAEKAAKETPEMRNLRAQLLESERLTIHRKAAYECARIAAWANLAPAGIV